MGSTAGRSKLVHLRCECFFATSMLSRPVAPPTSQSVWNFEKSNLSANASKLIRIKFFKHAFLAMLDLVLRSARPQRVREIVPEFEQPRVEHDQNAPDVTR